VVEFRKVVSVVFCDVVGSTALAERLDPEAVSLVLSRYFTHMAEAVERHGGRVEKFIGDAVVGVFGVPRSNEDDALRAVRAGIDMRKALVGVNLELRDRWGLELQVRIAINTGEVLAGEGELVMGDTANVAARLQHLAGEGEILLGEQTAALAGDAVLARPVGTVQRFHKGYVRPRPMGTFLRRDGST
jgi:class 3 adenylate cyclase